MTRRTRRSTSRVKNISKFLRRSPKLRKAARTAVVLAIGAFILLAVGAVIAKAARPYLITYNEAREIEQIKRQIAEAEAENKALREDIAYLQTKRGKEVEARKLGWVKKGEIAVIVEPTDEPADENAEGKASQVRMPATQVVGKWLLHLLVEPKARQ